MNKLCALYYPGSVVPDETLKACALYFDEVLVHDHMHVAELNLENLHTSPANEVFDDPNRIFDQSIPAGYIHLYGEYGHLRFLERTRILRDEGILITKGGLGNAGVASEELFEEQALLRGLERADYLRIAARTLAFGFTTPLFISNHFYEPLKHKNVRYVVRMILEFLFEAVFADSAEYSAIPITDDAIMMQQMEVFVRKFIKKKRRRSKPNSNIYGFQAVQNRLPSLTLCSYDDVLEARNRLNDELLEFREWLKVQTNFIRSNGLAGSAEDEARKIHSIIDSKVDAIERKVRQGRNKFCRKLAKGIAGASPQALLSALYPNMPIVLLAAAMAAMIGINVRDAWTDYQDSREDICDEAHGVSYLLKLKGTL